MRTKKVLALILAGAMVMGMTACGSAGKDKADTTEGKTAATSAEAQDATSAAAGGETTAAASGEDVELLVSHYYLEEERDSSSTADTFLTMVEQFEEENPNVTITQQVMSQSDYATKIQARAAVNEMPDVFLVKGSWMSNFVDNDVVAPINDYLDSYEYKDKFREGVFDAATKDGQIYGLPSQLSITSIVYYNADLWKSVGYDEFPDNWDDIYAATEKFNEKGITTFALGNSEKWPAESCILSTLGDRYTGTDWTNSIIANDGTAKFTDETFVNALTNLQTAAKNGVFNPDFNTITETQALEYFSNGTAATVVSGHWAVSNLDSFATDDVKSNIKVAVLPGPEAGKQTSISGGCGWYFAVNKNLTGAKLDAAMKFLFRTNGYEMGEYGMKTWGLTGPSIIDDVDESAFSPLTLEFLNLVNSLSLTPVYDLQMEGSVIEVMNTGIQELLNQAVTPEDLAAQIQTEQDNVGK